MRIYKYGVKVTVPRTGWYYALNKKNIFVDINVTENQNMKDRRINARKETIEVLIDNSQKLISDFEQLLHNVELIKSELFNNGLPTNYSQLIFELLSGSLLGLYEVCIDLKCMLGTSNVYAKRYHIQMINLSQHEWCVYLRGRDQNGVLSNLINLHNEKFGSSPDLDKILEQIGLLGKKCSIELRNMTAHYDKPYVMYKKLITINDEEVYVKRIGDQFLIHEMIFKYVSPFIQSISQTLSIRGIDSLKKRTLGSLNIQELINAKIAESLNHKEKLGVAIEEQIADAWNIIESQKRMFERCEKAILFLESKQLDSTRLIEIKSLVEIQLTVSFMRYDLACSMSTYLTASSNTEHSIAFMRAYIIETSALSHLYGYNEKHSEKSIWNKIKAIPEFKSISSSNEIENDLKFLTSNANSTKRNLYTHYREDAKLNISERWQCANEINHLKELLQMLHLVRLCKNINQFLVSLITAMDSTIKEENKEMLKPIKKIRDLASKNKRKDIVEMSDKLLSIFYDKNLQ